MATITIDRQLNGVTPFELFGRTYTWTGSNGNLDRISAYVEPGADTYDATYSLSGNMRIRSFELWYYDPVADTPVGGSRTTITDGGSAGNRRIDFLRIADGTNTITLANTVVETMTAFFELPSTQTTVTLGAARTGFINFGMGDTTINAGSGRIIGITLGTGNDVVNGGAGEIEYIRTGDGNDRFTAGTGRVTAVDTGSGNDTVIVGAGGRVGSVNVGDGNDTVQLSGNALIESLRGYGNAAVTLRGGSRIEQAHLTGQDVRVTIQNDARIFQLKTGEGTNRITTGDGFFESYFNFNGTNIVTVGAGGAGQLTFAGSAGTQTITGNGFISSLQVFDSARAVVTLNAGADYIRTGDANDRVTTTGDAFVGIIRTQGGNDTVTLGAGGAQLVNLGNGDDLLRVAAMAPDRAMVIQGGGGTDTVDFGRIRQSVTVDLSNIGGFQNIGAPGGTVIGVPGVIGYMAFSGIENLIGTNRADVLTGRETANRLEGGGGNDVLVGGAGNDTLLGGKGNDRLTGGADADVFQFARRDGTDRITDFELGLDQIAIAGVSRLGQITFSDVAAGARLVANGTTIIVEGLTAAEMRDADNFLF